MSTGLKHFRRPIPILGSIIVILAASSMAFYFLRDKTIPLSEGPIDDPAAIFWEEPDSRYAKDEEVIIVASSTPEKEIYAELPLKRLLFEYVTIIDSCGIHFQGDCVNARSGPGTDYDVVTRLRNDVVLKVDGKVERDGRSWFRIVFDEWLRYPERVKTDWYVSADYVEVLLDEGVRTTSEHGNATTTKHILVDRSEQKLYAYDGGELFMEASISTGLELSPTPAGTFPIFRKTPSRYMQGPIPGVPGSDYYDLPGVPWNLYFTAGGAVIHGAYWHDSFGQQYSHGCINMSPEEAKKLYEWTPLGTKVVVQE